ncbi:transcriptional regulator [Variovorax sp. JS1663]|uniref:transcriptional regulator n=1 Tax=Variovorax sp. JS1663 TaxID=1851577 RepID=UPI000B342A90|nr:transcriptional regulator [Variovorax sp. JS1663]OUM00553.1 hypothetical protein A8M77_21030 [Variovorax sp. JS1663]
MSQAEAQRELDLFRQPPPNDVPIELLRKQATAGAAFTLACSSSGLPDQSIYEFVGIDAGTFSKMKKGLATLQAEDWPKFCYAVNNRIWPEWCAFQVHCTLVLIKSEAERRAEAAEKRAEEAELKYRVLMETFNARAHA